MEWLVRHELGPGVHRAEADDSYVLKIPANADPVALLRAVPEPALWAYVRDEIIARPKYVAEQVGIEQIGYLADLPKPTPSPTLEQVGELFFKKNISDNWMAKCKIYWQEFQNQVEVKTLRELNQEHLLDYEEMVMEAMREGGHKSTYARQRYQGIKSIINYAPKRGKWAEDCQRVYAYAKVLIPPKKSATDPRPIDRQHFHKLFNAADEQMAAMLLLMLNACMYGGEVAALDWSELNLDNGTLATHREKTSVVRIAVLWPRTVAALRKLPRHTDALFLTNGTKMRHNYQTVYKAFKALRKSVESAAEIQLSDIRDGAYTSAVEAGVELDRVKLLAGHSTGISDAYVKRRPKMVAEACEAIQVAYFS